MVFKLKQIGKLPRLDKEFYSVAEVAKLARLSRERINHMIVTQNQIATVKVGLVRVIKRRDVEAFLASRLRGKKMLKTPKPAKSNTLKDSPQVLEVPADN